MATDSSVPKVLHCHSTFAAGGKELRAARLMNAFGARLDHAVISGEPDELGARAHLDRGLNVSFPYDFPKLTGLPTPGRLVAIAKAMAPQPVPRSATRQSDNGGITSSADSTSNSVSGLGINTDGLTFSGRDQNSQFCVR